MKLVSSFLVALTLLVGSAFAQNSAFAPYVAAGVSYSANNGTSNPNFNGGLGIESSTSKLLLDVNGNFQTANPSVSELNLLTVNGRGYTGSISGSAYLKVAKIFLIGGGANWGITHAAFESIKSNGIKSNIPSLDATLRSAHPFVGGGFQTKINRLLVSYALPGKDALTNERIVPVTNEFFVGKHLRLTQTVSLTSYSGNPALANLNVPFNGNRVSAVTAGAGVKFVF